MHFEDGYADDLHVKTTIDNAMSVSGGVGVGGSPLAAAADQSTQYNQLLFLKLEVLRWYLVKWRGTYDYIFWTVQSGSILD